jgi:hypothetical protein
MCVWMCLGTGRDGTPKNCSSSTWPIATFSTTNPTCTSLDLTRISAVRGGSIISWTMVLLNGVQKSTSALYYLAIRMCVLLCLLKQNNTKTGRNVVVTLPETGKIAVSWRNPVPSSFTILYFARMGWTFCELVHSSCTTVVLHVVWNQQNALPVYDPTWHEIIKEPTRDFWHCISQKPQCSYILRVYLPPLVLSKKNPYFWTQITSWVTNI